MIVLCRWLVGSVLAIALAACGHVPLSTMYHLRKFDPATFDPAAVRIAVQFSEVIEPRQRGTMFRMTMRVQGREPELTKHDFVLEPVPLANEPQLVSFRKAGQGLHVFRFSAEDAELIRSIQREASEARGKGRGGSIQIEVASKACRKGPLPIGAMLSTTLIRTEAASPFLVLLKDVDLMAEAKKLDPGLDVELPPC